MATKTKKAAKGKKKADAFEVEKKAAVALLVALGFKKAGEGKGWSDDKLTESLNEIDSVVDDDTEVKDKKADKLLDSILEALEDGKTITLSSGKASKDDDEESDDDDDGDEEDEGDDDSEEEESDDEDGDDDSEEEEPEEEDDDEEEKPAKKKGKKASKKSDDDEEDSDDDDDDKPAKKKAKKVKSKKSEAQDTDDFGSRLGSRASKVNLVFIKGRAKKKALSAAEILKEAKVKPPIHLHIKKLVERGHVKKDKKSGGFILA